eukprot:UN34075
MQQYHQRVGLDILDNLGTRLSACFDKMYRWARAQARDLENQKDLPLLSKVLKCLRDRPAFL